MDGAEGRDRPAADGPLLSIEAVSRRYGTVPAVDGVSLDVAAGEFFCLLGPSGCGKTTLLRLLAGFETPDGGRIRLDGVDIAGLPPHRRPVNMMFQSYALFPHMSVAGNVGYGLKRAGLGRRETAARVSELLALLKLDGLGGRDPAALSGGQRQRVALARALARRPRLLLLDEPLSALDRRLREETQVELKALQRRLGTTFVVVTHDQAEAMAVADRIAIMDRGRIAELGSPRRVYEEPRSAFAAAFLGDVNLVPGRATERRAGARHVATALSDHAFVVAGAPDLVADEAVSLAIRPEHVAICAGPGGAGPGGPGDNLAAGTVTDVSFAGASLSVRVTHPSGHVILATVPASPLAAGLEVGRGVTLRLPPERLRIFPERPGEWPGERPRERP